MPNQLNIISPKIRDFLLSKNLILSESIVKYGNNSWGNGMGRPAQIGLAEENVIDSQDIVENGELYKNVSVSVNKYKSQSTESNLYSTDSNSSEYYNEKSNIQYTDNTEGNLLKNSLTDRNSSINGNTYKKFDDLNPYGVSDGLLSTKVSYNEDYIEKYGKTKIGGVSTNAGDLIGSVISGKGIGFSPNGVEPNFDLRSSLAGRVLGATGIIDDTPLGKEAVKGLAFAMLNNVASNAQQETLGHVNTSVTNLLSGGDILIPNNDITVPKDGLGKATDLLQKITGFEVPRSFLSEGSSIFYFDSKLAPTKKLESINQSLFNTYDNNQELVENTGKGQRNALFHNLNANILNGINTGGGYAPDYKFKNEGVSNSDSYITDSTLYETPNDKFSQIIDVGEANSFTWTKESNVQWSNKKTLLSKTQELFDKVDGSFKTMINETSRTVKGSNEIQTDVNGRISKGNAVVGPSGEFCRTWTSTKRYNKLTDLQKHSGLYEGQNRLSDVGLSVLDENGFIRIGPKEGDVEKGNIKRFMFSLENLAWVGNTHNLRECEIGPGDGIDGERKGRIMWFPPYDLSFTDTSSVSWDTNEFIGRGEPIYTYNNTERTGTLSFKILTDHASTYHNFKYEKNIDIINQLIFGCETLPNIITQNLSLEQKKALEVQKAKLAEVETKIVDGSYDLPLEFFFPNDISNANTSYNLNYEDGSDSGIGWLLGEYGNDWENVTNDGLNVQFRDNLQEYGDFISKNETASIEIRGYASSQGITVNNIELATNRANSLKSYLMSEFSLDSSKFGVVIGEGEISVSSNNQDSLEAKKGRKCDIRVVNNPELSKNNKPSKTKLNPDSLTVNDTIASSFFSECSYFDYIRDEDELAYSNISDSIKTQIKFFQPSFHSITPEGFNSRLNFLLQCTRQGPTNGDDLTPSNLAFGRAPVCILRIGDFYHTKIIIDNVDFNFNEVQWDLNPEGIGVQPMIVDVSVSFKFIGGSSLDGPINKLQNAVSFNFFANTEMYDSRADSIKDGVLVTGETNLSSKEKAISKQIEDIATKTEPIEIDQVSENESNNSDVIEEEKSVDVEILRSLDGLYDTSFNIESQSSDGVNPGTLEIAMSIPSQYNLSSKYTTKTYNAKVSITSMDDNGEFMNEKEVSKLLVLSSTSTGGDITNNFEVPISLKSGNYSIKTTWDNEERTSNKTIITV